MINGILGRNPSCKLCLDLVCGIMPTKQPPTTAVLSQFVLFKVALPSSMCFPGIVRATCSLILEITWDELRCGCACVCVALGMQLGTCFKLGVRTDGGNAE